MSNPVKPRDTPTSYAEYRSTQEAPQALRTLDGARLSLEQINFINRRAFELGSERVIEDRATEDGQLVEGGTIHVQNFQAARGEFREQHDIRGDLWDAKTKDVN